MHRELRLSRLGGRLWALVLDGGAPVELDIEPGPDEAAVGTIYRGFVTEVRPDLRLAFLDLGDGGPAAALPLRDEPPRAGSALLVQVSREAVADKGPRVSATPRLAGRLLVLSPLETVHTVARSVKQDAVRRRLTCLLAELRAGGGLTARGSAADASEVAVRHEAERLEATWRALAPALTAGAAPERQRAGPDFLDRTLASAPGGPLRVVAADPDLAERVRGRLGGGVAVDVETAVGAAAREQDDVMLTTAAAVLRSRVTLRCGGRLSIEPTDALVAIDVDSGDARAERASVDLDAIRETARQLRLRGLGGTVVVDLLETSSSGRDAAISAARRVFAADPWRTRIAGVDADGLLRIVRERRRRPIASRLAVDCPSCGTPATTPSGLLLAARIDAAARRYEAVHGRPARRARLARRSIERVREFAGLGSDERWAIAGGSLALEADDSAGETQPAVD